MSEHFKRNWISIPTQTLTCFKWNISNDLRTANWRTIVRWPSETMSKRENNKMYQLNLAAIKICQWRQYFYLHWRNTVVWALLRNPELLSRYSHSSETCWSIMMSKNFPDFLSVWCMAAGSMWMIDEMYWPYGKKKKFPVFNKDAVSTIFK